MLFFTNYSFLLDVAGKPNFVDIFDSPLALPEMLSLSNRENGDYMELRMNGVYLLDKTDYIPRLIQRGAVIFRRPRRSGKSLAVSMLKYYFFGLTQLFEGTNIYTSTIDSRTGMVWCPSKPEEHYFPPCPVIHLDFCMMGSTVEQFKRDLVDSLRAISAAEKVSLEVHRLDSPGRVLVALINALVSSPWNKWRQVSEYIYMYIYVYI